METWASDFLCDLGPKTKPAFIPVLEIFSRLAS